MENQVKFRLFSNKPDAPKEAPKTVDPTNQCGCKNNQKGKITFVDNPYKFLKLERMFPAHINRQHFKVIANYAALSVGNPMVSDVDATKAFDIMRHIFSVRGDTIPTIKLATMSKRVVNRRMDEAYGRPLKKGMNHHKCIKDHKCPDYDDPKCNCSYDGTGYACGGVCEDTSGGRMCSFWPSLNDC
jgi:hypothetical protein